MLLAEKGLPRGANSGYELFDELGSLGLTSFMQEVTRVRALEGELAQHDPVDERHSCRARSYRAAGKGVLSTGPAATLCLRGDPLGCTG